MEENPANHLGCIKPVVNHGINYQPQLISRISSTNRMKGSSTTTSMSTALLPRFQEEKRSQRERERHGRRPRGERREERGERREERGERREERTERAERPRRRLKWGTVRELFFLK